MTGRRSFHEATGMAVILWCITISSTLQRDFLIPRWMLHVPDDNMTGVPISVLQLEKNVLQPAKLNLQNMFSFQQQLEKSRSLQKTQVQVSNSTEFFCNTNGTRSSTRPTSVHKLRPGDIDIIGSIGDSLTAGTGSLAYSIQLIFVDFRGTSWTGGGQNTWREFLTIPNILKVFNPKLFGYARGNSVTLQKDSQFNVAEVGAVSRDLLFMTRELVKRIKMDKRVNLNEDWKLISLMIGSNTFCLEICYEDYTTYAEKHKKEVLQSLLYLKENLPRTMVNLILSPNLEFELNLNNLPPICFLTQIMECPCLFATQYKRYLPDYIEVMKSYQKVEKEIVEHEELKNKEDFTVILQTFTENFTFPNNQFNMSDTRYLGSDCFHLSQKGYASRKNIKYNVDLK
ncbi:Hypothetical protein CINCED_3A001765 [Cinara cedri]|uniref:Phospholipase B1, membrane-associated n=1 Tax=Cinara cedri TaxID=506608 RepID=A0A5E4MFB0_9HEMI|nr:Hypothetical protein CINCED_3A001765 [Cinara cedri]